MSYTEVNNESDHLVRRVDELESWARQVTARNARVEGEKGWETSGTRRIAILAITYVTMVLTFWALNQASPFSGAIVPTLGFFLSSLSLPPLKRRWIARYFSSPEA